jgi:hypothetical protein
MFDSEDQEELEEESEKEEQTSVDSSSNPDSESPDSQETLNADDEEDALITETARILVDAINLSGPVMARADVK